MADNFTQTVNLREKMERERAAMLSRNSRAEHIPAPAPAAPEPARKPEKTVLRKQEKKKANEIDKIYKDDGGGNGIEDLRKISRPVAKPANEFLYRRIAVALAVVIALFAVYWLVFRQTPDGETAIKTTAGPKWYMVKLINGETYYGRIADTGADPVVLEAVYYNYDQLNPGGTETEEGGNLKLVKRGKETHGPAGTMNIVRAQVVYMEPLKDDSKVLKAILEHENK